MFAPKRVFAFIFLLLILAIDPTYGRGGRGGGGSRGGGSRGGSSGGSRGGSPSSSGSRGSPSSSSSGSRVSNPSSSGGTQIDRSGSGNSRPSQPSMPQSVRPSAPELPRGSPSNPHPHNPDFGQPRQPGVGGGGIAPNVNQPQYGNVGPGNPPPYGGNQRIPPLGGNPPPYSPVGNPPPYAPGGNLPPYAPGVYPPPYSPGRNPPPYVPGGNPPPYGPPAFGGPPPYDSNRPHVPQGNPPPYGVNTGTGPYIYPPGFHTGNIPHNVQPPYPRQPGVGGNFQHGFQPPQGSYPRQPGLMYPPSGFGSPYYVPGSGASYIQPHKKKGLLGGLLSVGKKPKHGGVGSFGTPSFGGSKISPVHMLIPAMAMKKSHKHFSSPFKHSYWMMPYAFHHHHHHHRGWGGSFDFDDDNYRGRCFRPRSPANGSVSCTANMDGVLCTANCKENYTFSDNSTTMIAQCWHYSGHWNRSRFFPPCKPHCPDQCLNGGKCKLPGVCRCSSEYRGDQCQHHVMNCDIRKLARGSKISWVCSHKRNETLCSIKCRSSLKFETPPAEKYHCHVNGTWTPDSIPMCVPEEDEEGE